MVIPMSEAQFASLAERAKEQGIELSGREGLIEKMGVTARWAYDGANLTVDVVDKPFFLSKESIEERLRAAFS